MMTNLYNALGFGWRQKSDGTYLQASITTVWPDTPCQMTPAQLKAFKSLWGRTMDQKLLIQYSHEADPKTGLKRSVRRQVFEFPQVKRQLWVHAYERQGYPVIIWILMMTADLKTGTIHGLGAWVVNQQDYLKVFPLRGMFS